MMEPRRMKVKVCLVGEHAVGKTSLIKRYVLNEYDDRYIVTLGAKVSKKELALTPKGADPVQMDMTIWDIMGSKGFRAVADITRYDTLEDLDSWVESVFRTVGEIPVTFAINKTDLKEQAAFGEEQVKQATEAFDAPYFFSSAKSGENVELLFRTLGETIAQTASKSAA